MPIAVLCPGCSSRITAPDAAAGKTVKCPKCKAPMVIPTPEPDPGFDVVEEPAPPPKKPAAPPKPAPTKPAAAKPRPVVVAEDEDEPEEKPRKKGKPAGGTPPDPNTP